MSGWGAVAIAAGLGTALVLRHPAPLADPITCPGMFDLLAIVAGRTWRDVPLASMLNAMNAVVLVLGLALLARAIYKITSSAGVAIAITLTASASVAFANALAPSSAAAFIVTIAAWSAVLRSNQDRQRATVRHLALALLALVVATVTPLMLPAAIVAGCLSWKKWHLRALAVLTVLGTSHLVQMALPQPHSCVMPDGGWPAVIAGVGIVAGAARDAGPLAIAIAVLGLVALKRLPRGVALSVPVLVLVSCWGMVVMPARPAWMLAPFVIAFWLLAAAGLAEVWEATGRTVPGKAGFAALSIVLIVLQVLGANSRRLTDVADDGHHRLTLAMVSELVGTLPQGAGLVAEDATISVLARSLPSRMRPPGRFHFVERDASSIAEELRINRVFALPRSQRVLQHLGLELADASGAGLTGLAEVRHTDACTSALGPAAMMLPQISGRQQFAMVAGDEQSRGPIVILLPADSALTPLPVSWPATAMRGFYRRTFNLSLATDRTDLTAELHTYELSSGTGLTNSPYVIRIEMWRTAGAPLTLPITLGGQTGVGMARILGTAAHQSLRLCPSFPYDVRPFARRP